jgi:hypothetical protein
VGCQKLEIERRCPLPPGQINQINQISLIKPISQINQIKSIERESPFVNRLPTSAALYVVRSSRTIGSPFLARVAELGVLGFHLGAPNCSRLASSPGRSSRWRDGGCRASRRWAGVIPLPLPSAMVRLPARVDLRLDVRTSG